MAQIQAFFAKWLARLPLPLTEADRRAGYDYRLSVWQVEVSRTQVFAEPAHGRAFFEEVIRENLDLGRPDRIQLVFERRVQKNTPGLLRTRVIQEGVAPSLHVEYKHCHVKQYFKEGCALRTETTINDPTDLRVGKAIRNLPYLQRLGREVNRRLLAVQRVSQACTLSRASVERLVLPTVTDDGQRAPGLRFGDRRVMALLSALILFVHLPAGLTHRALRRRVAAYLGLDLAAYTPGQMTYDLRRLRLKGSVVAGAPQPSVPGHALRLPGGAAVHQAQRPRLPAHLRRLRPGRAGAAPIGRRPGRGRPPTQCHLRGRRIGAGRLKINSLVRVSHMKMSRRAGRGRSFGRALAAR